MELGYRAGRIRVAEWRGPIPAGRGGKPHCSPLRHRRLSARETALGAAAWATEDRCRTAESSSHETGRDIILEWEDRMMSSR